MAPPPKLAKNEPKAIQKMFWFRLNVSDINMIGDIGLLVETIKSLFLYDFDCIAFRSPLPWRPAHPSSKHSV